MSESPRPTQWIVSPLVDLSFITLGWIAFYLTPHLFPQHLETIRLVSVTFLSGAHRYYTFPLVYFDRAEFGRRRGFYILAPVLVTVGVALCYYFRVDEPEMYGAWYLFNYFHFVRQKYGILRIYSGKSGYGHKPLDAWSTYAWGIGGFFYLLSYTTPTEGRFTYYLSQFFGGIPTFPIVVWTIYAAAAVLTLVWLVHELRKPDGLNLPKLLFQSSVVYLYGVGPLLAVGSLFIATSMSHAMEYIAIVGLTVKRKARTSAEDCPVLARAANHTVVNTLLFAAFICALLYGLQYVSIFAFLFFAYGTGFLHFIYDGMIWRIRRPKVAAEVGVPAAT